MNAIYQDAENWLRKMVRNAPHPLPQGFFPKIQLQAQEAGFSYDLINEVLDEWLNYGYCTITDPITNDIRLTAEGLYYFGKRG